MFGLNGLFFPAPPPSTLAGEERLDRQGVPGLDLIRAGLASDSCFCPVEPAGEPPA